MKCSLKVLENRVLNEVFAVVSQLQVQVNNIGFSASQTFATTSDLRAILTVTCRLME